MAIPTATYAQAAAAAGTAAQETGLFLKHMAASLRQDGVAAVRSAVEANVLLHVAIGASVVSATMLSLTCVYLLGWVYPETPLWIFFGVTSVPVLLFALVAFRMGQQNIAALQRLDRDLSVGLQEAQTVASSIAEATVAVDRAAHDTVESLSEAILSVKQSVDVKHHVEERPWTMIGGAVVLGYLGGSLLQGAGGADHNGHDSNGQGPQTHRGSGSAQGGGLLGKLGEAIAPEIQTLRDVAMGAVLAAVHDKLRSFQGPHPDAPPESGPRPAPRAMPNPGSNG